MSLRLVSLSRGGHDLVPGVTETGTLRFLRLESRRGWRPPPASWVWISFILSCPHSRSWNSGMSPCVNHPWGDQISKTECLPGCGKCVSPKTQTQSIAHTSRSPRLSLSYSIRLITTSKPTRCKSLACTTSGCAGVGMSSITLLFLSGLCNVG